MKANVGQTDRIVRVLFGVILLAIVYVFKLVTPGAGTVVVTVVGLIMLGTGAVGW